MSSPLSAGSPRVRAKRERRREQILQAALRAFRESGFHDTTLEDIAKRLDIRSTALYHYFPDKESILYECHRGALEELERILEDARRIPRPAERLRHIIREHVRVVTESLGGLPLGFEITGFSADRQAEIIAARDRYERELRRLLELGIREGSFREVDVKLATFVVLGAINGIGRWYRPEGGLSASELGARFAEYLLGGLAARAEASP